MNNTSDFLLKLGLSSLLFAATASAEYKADKDPVTAGNQPGSVYTPVTLSGTTRSEGWESLTASNYPGNGSFPGTAAWVSALASQVGANAGSAGLAKLSNGAAGGPYPASSSIYFGSFGSVPNTYGGTLAVQASGTAVLSGVKTVVFQLDIGEAWTYDLHDDDQPVLTYTTSAGTFTAPAATYASRYAKVFNGQVLMNGVLEDLYINSRAYQFDVSGAGSAILSFSIRFDGVEHAQVHGTGLQQTTTTTAISGNVLRADIP